MVTTTSSLVKIAQTLRTNATKRDGKILIFEASGVQTQSNTFLIPICTDKPHKNTGFPKGYNLFSLLVLSLEVWLFSLCLPIGTTVVPVSGWNV
jgi:hypothetical protein